MTQRLHRDRSLPADYQYGDAADRFAIVMCSCADFLTCEHPWPQIFNMARDGWRPPHLNAADRLARHAGWNVIEGEHFDSDEERHRTAEGAR